MNKTMFRLCLLAASGVLGCARGSTDDIGGDDLASIAEDGGTEGTSIPAPQGNGFDAGTRPSDDAGAPAADAGTDAKAPPSGACAYSGPLVSFDLSKLSGSPANVTPSTQSGGVTATALKRVGVTAVSSSGAFNASNWPTGAVDKGKYFTFSVAPPAGCRITVTKVSLTLDASNTGPSSASIGTSADAYGALKSASIGNAADVTLQGVSGIDGVVEVRVYGSSAQSTGGTLRLDSALSLTGSLAPL